MAHGVNWTQGDYALSFIRELEQQLELMSQKTQFFEMIADVLKKDYGVLVVKTIQQVISQGQLAGLGWAGLGWALAGLFSV